MSNQNHQPNKKLTDRRSFLTRAAAGVGASVAFHIVPRHVLGGGNYVAPSEKVHIGLIGCGGRAEQNMAGIIQHPDAQIIAIADPAEQFDTRQLAIYQSLIGRMPIKAKIETHYQQKDPNYRCRAFADFREMLKEEPAIDAVVISTPDHQHAHGALYAMRQGKHVYCEKPLTHNVREARLVAQVADETGVATQMGNQGHSKATMAQTVEALRAGVIGTVREVHAWVSTRRWNPDLVAPPEETPPVPGGLNWDLWLGPRSERPFHPAYAPVHWRDFWDFGCGALGDFACHDLDSATWGLDLAVPSTVQAFTAGQTHEQLAPHGSICHFDFPAQGRQQQVKVTWYDGGLMPRLPAYAKAKHKQYRRGVLFVGEKGTMLCKAAGGTPWIVMNDGTTFEEPVEATIPRVKDHYRDWLDACKGGRPALSNFQYGARLTEITLLGVLAVRLAGQELTWDPEAMRVTGVPEADVILNGKYRTGWEV